MSRRRSGPSYRFHKATGKAITTYDDEAGRRRSILLPGRFNSKESLAEFKRVKDIVAADGQPRPASAKATHISSLSIAELIERYWQHVETYYRREDGTKTQEVACMMYALRPLKHLHGETIVDDFGPMALKSANASAERRQDPLIEVFYLPPPFPGRSKNLRNS